MLAPLVSLFVVHFDKDHESFTSIGFFLMYHFPSKRSFPSYFIHLTLPELVVSLREEKKYQKIHQLKYYTD